MLLITGLICLMIPPVSAHDRIRHRGDCTGPSRWRLVVRRASVSSLRVRFVIAGGLDGQTWQLFLSDNGQRIFSGNRGSRDGGRVRARRITSDRAGTDRIKGSGVNMVTGESCSGSVSI
jgi:hypothetical protein